MIKDTFDPSRPLRFVRYARMSSDRQNPRSPDQQLDEIERTRRRRGCEHWVHVSDYRDDGISGRYLRKRRGFMGMLEAIRSGRIATDLVLVDTITRFGRAEEIEPILHELWREHGVVVLSADQAFADPTSEAGRFYRHYEVVRAQGENREKAHAVLRGKLDAALAGRWPGGPPPRGYRLEARTEARTSARGKVTDHVHHVLVPDPAEVPLIQKIFQLAADRGWGRHRIARHLNSEAEFSRQHGPISEAQVGHILTNPIYIGTLRFNAVGTDVVRDRRVVRAKPEDEVVQVERFCEPLVSAAVWAKVNATICARRQRVRKQRAAKAQAAGKQLQPLVPGLVLTYPLSGLVRCARCEASMRPCRSGTKRPDSMSYYYYRCPCAGEERCTNRLYLPGPWLWRAMIAHLRERLFPLPAERDHTPPPWLGELLAEVRRQAAVRQANRLDRPQMLGRERDQIEAQLKGWTASLGSASLSAPVRQRLEAQMEHALARRQAIDDELAVLKKQDPSPEDLVGIDPLIDRLRRLEQLLAGASASDLNVELGLHIQSIRVEGDGTVVLHGDEFGVFEGASVMLAAGSDSTDQDSSRSAGDPSASAAKVRVRPRMLPRRQTAPAEPGNGSAQAVPAIPGPVQLPSEWVDPEALRMPRAQCWSRRHAQEVLRYKMAHPEARQSQIAAHFEVSRPTIRAALRHAQRGATGNGQVRRRRQPSRPGAQDHRQIAEAAARLYFDKEDPLSMKRIAARLGVHRNTVAKAIDHWCIEHGHDRPDGRSRRRAT